MDKKMKNELRYIDLGSVSKEMYTVLWEYDNVIELKEPTLIRYSARESIVDLWQGPYWDKEDNKWKNKHTNIEDYVKGLPDITFVRPYMKLEIPYNAEMSYYVTGPHITNFQLYYPNIGRLKEDKDKRSNLMGVFIDSIGQILLEQNIESERNSNDILFKHNGYLKKFVGTVYRPTYNPGIREWGTVDMSITYEFDSETANRVRTFEGGIRVKKFDAEDVSEVVGGLWEIDPTIEKDKLETELVNRVCKKLDLIIKNDSLSDKEESKLFERGNRRLTEEQWYLYGNNDEFE